MKLGTLNIRNFPDMKPRQVASCAQAVMFHTTLAGLQEITPGEDSQVIQGELHGGWRLLGAESTNPVLVNTHRWRVMNTAVQRHRRPPVGRPENPHHDVVSVVLRSVKRPHLPAFAVVNTHLVSGGYNGEHSERVREQWDTEWDVYVEEVMRRRHEGLTVYPLGDLNNPRPPNLEPHRRFRWLTPQGPADHIGQLWLPGSVQLEDYSHERVNTPSDHDLWAVSGRLGLA